MANYNTYTEEEIQLLLTSSLSHAALARKLGRTPRGVKQARMFARQGRLRPHTNLAEIRLFQAELMLSLGMEVKHLAKLWNISTNGAFKYLYSLGIDHEERSKLKWHGQHK